MENKNNINYNGEWLKEYVKNANYEQLQEVNDLLESGNKEELNKIIKAYSEKIINNRDLKESDKEPLIPIKGAHDLNANMRSELENESKERTI